MRNYLRTLSRSITGLPAMLLALCVLTLTPFTASASAVPAPETATGTVLDSYGDPMPGASVIVVGTKKGTSTDIDGNFSIPGVERGQTLRISFIGCTPQEVKWEGTPLNITLEDEENALQEVVVVGFGTQKKANLTGAVSTVTGKEIAARPVNSVADALQGMAAGLDVLGSSMGGALNGTRSMNIRGTGTIGTGSSVNPLVLIDGMEGDINELNPADVENISILKDAAASSIYGSRAAGGVILVTTKNGKEGKITVNYSDSFRWSHMVGVPKMMDSYSWANYMNTGSINSKNGVWFTEEKLAQLKAAQSDPSMQKMFRNPANNRWEVWDVNDLLPLGNTDWLQEHFGKTSFSQEHNISITGGGEKYNFYFSANYLGQEGILRHGDDNKHRYIVNARINVNLTDWLTFGYNARWYRNEYDAPSLMSDDAYNIVWHNVARYWPIIPTNDPNGYPVVESYINALENGGRYKKWNDQFTQQFSLRANPIEGLNLNAEVNYRTDNTNVSRVGLQCYGWDVDGNPYERNPDNWWVDNAGVASRVYNYNYRANYFNPNIYGDYSFDIADDHEFKVMAGFQSEWYKYYDNSGRNDGVINNLPFLSMTSGKNPIVRGGTATWSTAGWFGRLNYDYKGRYLVEGNIRYDGSSRFRADSRWTWSPSFSLGWNIAREAFWEDFVPTCNTLKLRYSWGKLGNQNTNSWYPTYANMGWSTSASGWLVNGTKPSYATMPGLISETLTWEKNRTWDIGLDWGLFNNRLTGTFDYYQRKTEDMVGPGSPLPDVLGASVPNVNNLSMTSRGWELTIGWRDRIGEFSYGVTANLYDHTITIDEYPNPTGRLDLAYYNGMKLGEIWGFTSVGLAKTQEEMDAHLAKVDQSILGSGWTAGDMMYADIDGDGEITQGEYVVGNSGDYQVIGNSTPRYSFGLNLDAQWKGFDLKIFFQGVGKRDYWAGGPMMFGACNQGKWQAVGYEPQLDYFRPADTTDPLGPNLDAYYPRPNWGGPNSTYTQTKYLQNAAYCRLKNLTVGYTLPASITRKAYIERARIFFSGENLFNITSFTKLGDPEMIEAYAPTGFGKAYPLSRVFSCGLNVTF